MFSSDARRCAVAAICLAAASCAAPSNNEQAAMPVLAPEVEEPLTLSVDVLDIRHGSLRIEASMADGSADVSMWLGEGCPTREVGRGIATPAGFAWSLSRDEIASAIECSLVVKVRAIDDEGHRVRRVAALPVSVQLQTDGDSTLRLFRLQPVGPATKLTFLGPVSVSRMHVAGTVIGVESEDDYVGRRPKGWFASTFVVGNDDLARSMLARRRLTLLGEHYLAAISVGSMTLDISEPQPEPVLETVPETSESSESNGEGYGESSGDG